MEFHNPKLLPKGLPEIIAQLVPYEIYPDTKVIAYPRKLERGLAGRASCDGQSYWVKLFPIVISFHHSADKGTISFSLWLGCLRTALHEIGHLATRRFWLDLPTHYSDYSAAHFYVEKLADRWADQAMARILRVDPRLGQPPGALTGYPGMVAYRLRNCGRPWNGEYYYPRVLDWRGLGCNGQIAPNHIADKFISSCNLYTTRGNDDIDWQTEYKLRLAFGRILRHEISKAARDLGIERYFVNKNGRRYLMFNVGEAEAVYEWLAENRRMILVGAYRMLKLQQEMPKHWMWELVDGSWELVGIKTPIEVSPEQMRLPF